MQPHLYLGTPWHWYSREFGRARTGWEAWVELEDELSGKGLDLGIYRHGPSHRPGVYVTVVSLHSQGVLRARSILRLRGGWDVQLGVVDWFGVPELEALIARRIRAVTQLAAERPGEAGSAVYHHLGQGQKINPDGTYS